MLIKEIAFLGEMAAPAKHHLAKTYYHGTSSDKAAEGILQHGIQPGDIVMPERHKAGKGPNLAPVKGRVYITPDIGYAQMYAIGGDYAGRSYTPKESTGYLFVINGKDLHDIQPDEDSIGELAYHALTDNKNKAELHWLIALLYKKLTDNQLRRFKDAEYVMWAHFGKKVLPTLTDEQKLQLIDLGAHVAHDGALIPSAAYKIDLKKVPQLKRDGSNFFDHAEKIK